MAATRRAFLSSAAIPLCGAPAVAALAPYQFHPDFQPDPRVQEIFRDLASPLHGAKIRDVSRTIYPGEADLSKGYRLEIAGRNVARDLAASLEDFRAFLSVAMDLKPAGRGYRLKARIGQPEGAPADAGEAFHADITADGATLTARDSAGLRRALIHLEDEMSIRRAPYLPLGAISRWSVIEDRISRSPVAPYRWLSGWELEQDGDFYPDQYLNKLAHCGMNGIWVAGLLSRLIASRTLPELGPKTHQLERLNRLIGRARQYGINVFLFCVEPRHQPKDHPVFTAHPEIRGALGQCLCTSTPLVKDYIREMMRELFAAAPQLAGVINIYNGERYTTGVFNEKMAATCPRCRDRRQAEVLAEDLNCFYEGIRQSSKTAKLLAWGYSGNTGTDFRPLMSRLHPEIAWLGNFEHDGEKMVHGRKVGVQEYSLSAIGPSSSFANVASSMVEAGRAVYAKLQMGNSYELSSEPYIPVPGIAYEKLVAARKSGARGSMLSWVIGGYPSAMLKIAGETSFAPVRTKRESLTRLAAAAWGPGEAGRVVEAWNHFAEAFQLYLCAINVFYFGPITRCPAYHLHLGKETRRALPYNWGLTRLRVPQPFEDEVTRWLGPNSAQELSDSFREMSGIWRKGLALLEASLRTQPGNRELRRQHAVAAAADLQFLSMANAVEFYTLRDTLAGKAPEERRAVVRRLRQVVEDDIALARQMLPLQRTDCLIGFESEIYDYSFSPRLLEAKIAHDERTAKTLAGWERNGVDLAMLAPLPVPAPVPTAPARWQDWLRWGD